jgi:tetratricopeptide (TPR) repeat protein
MHEELINTLAKIEALRVISRTSAMIYKGAHKSLPQIARELNVDAIVEGSVLQSGGRVRIAVELFEGKPEKQVWAQSYERDLRDVLTLQAEVAGAIAREIQVKLTPQEKQRLAQGRQIDPEAYLAYSYGRFYWNKRTPEGFPKAIEYFQRAIAKDPGYAPAHAGLADALALLGSIGSGALPPKQVMPKAKAEALEAVRLDDNLAEAHTSLAYVKLSYDWDLDAAEREFKRAIELNPRYATAHHWYAHYFLAKGQTDQALAEITRAEVLDPLSFVINVGVGWCLYHAHRYDDAIQQYRKALDLNPDFSLAHCTLGMALVQKKLYEEALVEFNKAKSLPGSPTVAMANIGGAYALSGRRAEARHVLAELLQSANQHYVPAIYIAAIYTALGDTKEAMRWMQQGYDERADYMVYLKTEPWADSLRTDPRFQHLMQVIASGHRKFEKN